MKISMILIAGSLGSGKTTLLRHLVTRADRRTAILMNEFGEIAIDSKVVEGEHIRMTELAGGCVCCSLAGEFEEAVKEIVATVRPELIVVETTGVAEPDAVIFDVEDNLQGIRLDSVVVVADADLMVRFPDLGYVTTTQFEAADLLLLNKVDLVSPCQLDVVEAQLRRVNSDASVVRTLRCALDTGLVFGAVNRGPRPLAAPSSHSDLAEVDSFDFVSDRPVDREKFERLAENMPKAVYRSKGFLRCVEAGFLFNFAGGRWALEPFEAERTELVFIGRGAAEARVRVLSELEACLV